TIENSVNIFLSYSYRLDLHSFPTRRSSDLPQLRVQQGCQAGKTLAGAGLDEGADDQGIHQPVGLRRAHPVPKACGVAGRADLARSEEHTSELRSRENLVCRLRLEKKKNKMKKSTKLDRVSFGGRGVLKRNNNIIRISLKL